MKAGGRSVTVEPTSSTETRGSIAHPGSSCARRAAAPRSGLLRHEGSWTLCLRPEHQDVVDGQCAPRAQFNMMRYRPYYRALRLLLMSDMSNPVLNVASKSKCAALRACCGYTCLIYKIVYVYISIIYCIYIYFVLLYIHVYIL